MGNTDSLKTAQSIVWMLEQLAKRRRFTYEEWSREFNQDQTSKTKSGDRKFFNHLKFLREEALPALASSEMLVEKEPGDEWYTLKAATAVDLLELSDTHWADYFPIVHGLNRHKSLVPFPTSTIEATLQKAFDIPEELLGRVIYKSSFDWKLDREHLRSVFDAIYQRKYLKVIPQPPRLPASIVPLFLINYDGGWFLVGEAGKQIQQYALSRVLEVSVTEESHPALSQKRISELRKRYAEVFGISLFPNKALGGEPILVKVRFKGDALPYALARFAKTSHTDDETWHQCEQSEDSLSVELKVNDFKELIGELLRWGSEAEAVSPESFRQAWLAKIHSLTKFL